MVLLTTDDRAHPHQIDQTTSRRRTTPPYVDRPKHDRYIKVGVNTNESHLFHQEAIFMSICILEMIQSDHLSSGFRRVGVAKKVTVIIYIFSC